LEKAETFCASLNKIGFDHEQYFGKFLPEN